MQLLAYGEDSLTLWALTNRLLEILQAVNDSSDPSLCRIFYRPSYGRGGESSFGEFDFVILSEYQILLGESKWDNLTGKIPHTTYNLRPVQRNRHVVFTRYLAHWAYGEYTTWAEFQKSASIDLDEGLKSKTIPGENTTLAKNLQTIFKYIKNKYTELPAVINILLFLYKSSTEDEYPKKMNEGFYFVPIAYGDHLVDNFIKLEVTGSD